jgi:hypothetical protein
MIESFLVSLALAVIKYYAGIAGQNISDYLKERKELKENEKKAEDYQKIVDSPANREERRRAEDDLLS